jgi:hypothetical protein
MFTTGHFCRRNDGYNHDVGHLLLLLCNAKTTHYRKNKVFKGLVYYSAWPQVADAMIKALRFTEKAHRACSIANGTAWAKTPKFFTQFLGSFESSDALGLSLAPSWTAKARPTACITPHTRLPSKLIAPQFSKCKRSIDPPHSKVD